MLSLCSLWAYLIKITQQYGTTVLITTHYIEEAKDANKVSLATFCHIPCVQEEHMFSVFLHVLLQQTFHSFNAKLPCEIEYRIILISMTHRSVC